MKIIASLEVKVTWNSQVNIYKLTKKWLKSKIQDRILCEAIQYLEPSKERT